MERIVILTGAGISAESGLGTFRDRDGLWSRVDLAAVATLEGYARDPAWVLDLYNGRRRGCRAAAPNPAHHALASLVAAHPERVDLITQNIDDLHERADTARVLHMHGQIARALCARCGHRWDWEGDMVLADRCAACARPGTVRPDVVWFGEMPYGLERIERMLTACDLFMAIGTSGSVYPAAGFVTEAAARGARTLEINLEAGEGSPRFRDHRFGPASETVPAWVEALLRAG